MQNQMAVWMHLHPVLIKVIACFPEIKKMQRFFIHLYLIRIYVLWVIISYFLPRVHVHKLLSISCIKSAAPGHIKLKIEIPASRKGGSHMHRLKSIEIASCFTAMAGGVLLHFLYDWSGHSPFAAWLAPVSESAWEHLKLLFFPLLFISIAEYYLLDKPKTDYWNIKTYAILLAMAVILAGFYTYSGILGFTLLPVDIALFFCGIAVSFWYSYRYLREGTSYTLSNVPFFLILAVTALLFALFTWLPPRIPLFEA